MKIRNFTPHTLVFEGMHGQTIEIESEGIIRVSQSQTFEEWTHIEHDGKFIYIPLTRTVYEDVMGLPPEEPNTLVVVSSLVRMGSNRKDLVSPAALVREDGEIKGAKTLTH